MLYVTRRSDGVVASDLGESEQRKMPRGWPFGAWKERLVDFAERVLSLGP